MHEFHCPHCSIPLRVRDPSFRNRTIECPECHRPVLIQETQQGLTGVVVEPVPPVKAPRSPKSSRKISVFSGVRKWLPAGVAAILVLALLLYVGSGPETDTPVDPPALRETSPQAAAIPEPVKNVPDHPSVDAQAPHTPEETLREKYRTLFGFLSPDEQPPESYPRDVPGAAPAGWSWIAPLAERHLASVRRHRESGWNAPVNDEFVRRPFAAFQNPLIAAKAGEDHYPATHFVGVSGVGIDAVELPKTDPRAGIFSTRAGTRPEDVTDGLSQTMLLAGVTERLGSWARPGSATVRSFDQPPYVNGPDGFGTGQADSMFVLMADGSVRTLSSKTDATVVRRLATIADGQNLDPRSGKDPLKMKPEAPPAVARADEAKDRPIEVPMAADAPVFDLKPRLEQRLLLFEQSRPVPLEKVAFDLQELAGVAIDLSALSAEQREQPVTLSMENATVQEILEQLGKECGLRLTIQPNLIQYRTSVGQ